MLVVRSSDVVVVMGREVLLLGEVVHTVGMVMIGKHGYMNGSSVHECLCVQGTSCIPLFIYRRGSTASEVLWSTDSYGLVACPQHTSPSVFQLWRAASPAELLAMGALRTPPVHGQTV